VVVWKLENIPPYEVPVSRKRPHKEVFKRRLKVATVAESVTRDGSVLQTRAPATGKARSSIVILRVGGTTSADVDAEAAAF